MMKPKYTRKQIQDWFKGKIQNIMNRFRTPDGIRKEILNRSERSSDITVIGKMYFFMYDPKHKDDLPQYDKFPLVFPIEPYSDGFLGLNLHYLSVGERLSLLEGLKKFADDKTLTPSTKLNLSYQLLNSTKGISSAMRPCVKRYLFSHVRSPFIEVTADEWDKAAQLTVENFVYNQKR
jgi:hypothetical protein